MNWLNLIAWISLILSAAQAVVITIDVIRHRQTMMPIMNIVWPLIGLFFPVVGLWAYLRLGREQSSSKSHSDVSGQEKPFWQSVFVSTTHCSAGCSLGDMVGAPLVFLTGILIAGSSLLTDYIVEFVLAYIFGIAFQYFGMGFTKHQDPKAALKNAIKADTLSLIAFEVGMFGWMALVSLVFFATPPEPDSPIFWLMMQIAMMLGFLTSYPANWVLVKQGVKHAM
ncbi:Phospholipase_D-nuclease N-terminal [Brevibacterium linens]|uniref:Phospholipase_D-nuclease N-terminal n=2 Tax=Brevibacterium linens TaxID=1703 RepID=A0A2H1KK63_BRELN|nr:Phospholipase_D-nuclease N-terminal [Brevibacterium linens]